VKFFKSKMNDDSIALYFNEFSEWLNKYLEKLPSDVVAVNFNLYEGVNKTYDIQLIGTDEFDEDDEDWACSDFFSTEEDIYLIPRTKDISNWQDGLNFITKIIEKYLDEGKYSDKLKQLKAVGVGFVDGDINILYQN